MSDIDDYGARLKAARDRVTELRADIVSPSFHLVLEQTGQRSAMVDDLIAAVRALAALESSPPVVHGPSPEALIARGRPHNGSMGSPGGSL